MSALRHFDGRTYDPARDSRRLTKQWEQVRDLMLDGRWRTLRQISDTLAIPEASVSARLRDLRKPRFGGFNVERRNHGAGTHHYRIPVGIPAEAARLEQLERLSPAPVIEPDPVLFADEPANAIFGEAE